MVLLLKKSVVVAMILSKLCVPDVAKNMIIQSSVHVLVSNMVSRINETRHILRYETEACKCRLDASVSNNRQHWNSDKCRCEFAELIDKGRSHDGLYGIIVFVNANVINHVMLVNI